MPRDKLETYSGANYHKEYYKKNKELIRAKRMLLSKGTFVSQDVKQWKIDKMNDPWAFYPFYDPNSKKRYGDECETASTSITDISSSLSTSIYSKDAL